MTESRKFEVDAELLSIFQEIVSEQKSLEEWAEVESDDMFQSKNYLGGFDATEMEFCFSVFIDDDEFWFQVSLSDVQKCVSGQATLVNLRPSEK